MDNMETKLTLPLYLQIPELHNLTSQRREVFQEQQKLLETLSNPHKYADLVISLRYLYNPRETEINQRLQIYLILNHSDVNSPKPNLAHNLFTKGQLNKFYNFKNLDNSPNFITQFTWVNIISEIVKQAEIWIPQSDNDMVSLCDQLTRLDHPLMIDITLQTCNTSDYSTIAKLTENNDKYLNNLFFKYSLKILAHNEQDLHLITDYFLQNALSNHHYSTQEIILRRDSDRFQQLLNATEKVALIPEIDNSYLNPPLIPKKTTYSKTRRNIIRFPETEPLKPDHQLGSSGEIVKIETNWSLGKYFESPPKSDLASNIKGLSQLVTPQEISGLFRLVVAGERGVTGIPKAQPKFIKATAEEIFNQYADQISEDQYILGIKDDGNIVYANWNDIPHRLVAGITRSGKTNFLHWIIFQILYAQSQSKIYIMDFKGGGDFIFYQRIDSLKSRVKLITTVEEGHQLLIEEIDQDFERRKALIQEQQRNKYQGERILIIVDEAADIALETKTDKIKREIDGKLEKIARKGASFKIHLIYCTQTPKIGIINTQVTSQLSNRTVFHIKAEVGNSVLEDRLLNYATKIPEISGRGRAALASNDTIEYVNTPEIKNFPTPDIPIYETLWGKI
jgi:hypothetical protein